MGETEERRQMECGQDGGDSGREDSQSQRKIERWRICVPGKQRKRGAEKHEKSETERDGRSRERPEPKRCERHS